MHRPVQIQVALCAWQSYFKSAAHGSDILSQGFSEAKSINKKYWTDIASVRTKLAWFKIIPVTCYSSAQGSATG